MDKQMTVLVPVKVGLANITSSSAALVGPGETAWNSGTSYAGTENKINYNGELWSAIAPSTNVAPGTDFTKWRRSGPSNRMAPFDDKISTVGSVNGELSYKLEHLDLFEGIALYGLRGVSIDIVIKDSLGVEVHTISDELWDQPMGLYEYLFEPQSMTTQKSYFGLPTVTGGSVEISVSDTEGGPCEIGMMILGHWVPLLTNDESEIYGVEFGAEAQIKTYSYIKTEDDGSTTIVPRATAVNVSVTAFQVAEQSNYTAHWLRRIASVPLPIIISNMAKYDYLNTFGLVSGSITASNPVLSKVSLQVKGFI